MALNTSIVSPAEGYLPKKTGDTGYETKLYLVVRFNIWSSIFNQVMHSFGINSLTVTVIVVRKLIPISDKVVFVSLHANALWKGPVAMGKLLVRLGF